MCFCGVRHAHGGLGERAWGYVEVRVDVGGVASTMTVGPLGSFDRRWNPFRHLRFATLPRFIEKVSESVCLAALNNEAQSMNGQTDMRVMN